MGDIYWCLTKMESFMKAHNYNKIDAYVYTLDAYPLYRGLDYLSRFPFVEPCGYYGKQIDENIFSTPGGEIHNNIMGMDHVFWFNKSMERGNSVETDIHPAYATNWYVEMYKENEIETKYINLYKRLYGEYVVLFYKTDGFYNIWSNKINISKIERIAKYLKSKNIKLILTGAHWDIKEKNGFKGIMLDNDNIVDLIGRTAQIDAMFGLLKGSVANYGMAAGNLMKSVYFKKPTVMLWWPEKAGWNSKFMYNSLPKDSLNNWYYPIHLEHYDIDKIIETFDVIFQKGTNSNERYSQ